MIFKAKFPVEPLPGDVAALDFEMESLDIKIATRLQDELHGLRSQSPVAMTIHNK